MRAAAWVLVAALLLPRIAAGQQAETNSPTQVFAGALARLVTLFHSPTNEPSRTFATTVRILKADGLPGEMAGHELELAIQAPDHLRISTKWKDQSYIVGRDGEDLWVHVPGKKFGLIGSPNVPRFSTSPASRDTTPLGPLKLPLPAEQLMLLPLVTDVEALSHETVGGAACHVLKITPKPEAASALKLPRGTFQFWLRESDFLPVRLAYQATNGVDVRVELAHPQFGNPAPAFGWKLQPGEGDKIESVARSHLTRFLGVASDALGQKIPALGPATGERRVVAREGDGRLEDVGWHARAVP